MALLNKWRRSGLQLKYLLKKSCLQSRILSGFWCVEVLNDWVLPTVVQKGDKVDLRCNFELSGENMYSLKWYRDNVEFYRIIPSVGLDRRV